MYDRTVKLPGTDQNQIKGLQLIAFAFDGIGYISTEKDQDLVEIMIMKGKFSLGVILDVKEFKIAVKISGFHMLVKRGYFLIVVIIHTYNHSFQRENLQDAKMAVVLW